ncbi:MAG: hypothetical protein HFI34_08810 [Lachnospiraceae bacterium]|nr:hypothetical protein [Lachnospiraceae bacterium]
MKHRIDRIKKYIKCNKNAAIYITILIVYTIVMLCIWLIGSDGLKSCSSGSLSSIMNDNTETTTESSAEDITTSEDIPVD